MLFKNQQHFLKKLTSFSKIGEVLVKIPENVNKISPEFTLSSENLNLDNSL